MVLWRRGHGLSVRFLYQLPGHLRHCDGDCLDTGVPITQKGNPPSSSMIELRKFIAAGSSVSDSQNHSLLVKGLESNQIDVSVKPGI